MKFAVDTGGTFTDLVLDTGAEIRMFKAHTTPDDPVEGVLNVLGAAAEGLGLDRADLLGQGTLFIHGTTRAINALVTGSSARVAFLTTAGHPDVLLFREGGRIEPFDFSVPYPKPLVPRALTFEVPERVTSDGRILEALDEGAVVELLDLVRESGAQAIAVSFLWSIINPAHELRVGELIEEHLPGMPFTLAHELNPSLREYRRASSSCIDASLKPLMTSYFGSLEKRLREAGFRGRTLIVTSQGATLDAGDIAAAPIHSINSGPSMAPVAGRHYAEQESGARTVIIADTGGTTFDVSVVRDGVIPRTRETWLGRPQLGHITGFPSVDVTSVGAGGGSIAWVDEGGLLHVGPQSAGSVPGPACYGQGGKSPTLTDACVVLGYVDPEYFLGGTMSLDLEGARVAIAEGVAGPLGMDLDRAALAVVEVATENMVGAIEEITINQGVDPRGAVVIGGGGAAGLNLAAIGSRLGCAEAIIPSTGAALSAAGAMLSDLSADFSTTLVTSTSNFDFEGVNRVLWDLRQRCEEYARANAAGLPFEVQYYVEARYPRQNWELEVPIELAKFEGPADVERLVLGFHEAHERVFAIRESGSAVEVLTWRAVVHCKLGGGGGQSLTATGREGLGARKRDIYLDGGWVSASLVDLDALDSEAEIAGPAVAESSFTTVVVGSGAVARTTANGNLIIDLTGAK